jgi:glycosyltransferase involved in cell wall biosynthesis
MSSLKSVDSLETSEEEFLGKKDTLETDSVAVGVVVSDAATDQVARVILRAVANDYPVFIISSSILDSETARFVEQLDGKVINSFELEDSLTLENTVSSVADSHGFSHVIVHTDLAERIDYERTKEVIETTDRGPIEPILQTEPSVSPSLIAAIPAYNEAGTIGDVVTEASQYVDEVIVVDDGSSDNTAQLADDAGATVVVHETNTGYGGALQTAFSEANKRDVEHLVIIDGDGQHDIGDIERLVDVQRKTASEIVIGNRHGSDSETSMPLYRRFGLAIINIMTNLSLGIVRPSKQITDTQSGFRAYSGDAVESLSMDQSLGTGMNASTDILYHGFENGYQFEEVSTTINYDLEDTSSQNPVSHGLKLVHNILNTVERKRPIGFLGVPGFIFSFFGIVIAYLTLSNFMATGTFPLGMALVSSVVFLMGLFMGLTATVLHALKQHL